MIWDLVTQISGRLTYAGMGGSLVGIDAAAFLALGEAKGLPRALLAEFLPAVEAAVIGAIRKSRGSDV